MAKMRAGSCKVVGRGRRCMCKSKRGRAKFAKMYRCR